MKSTIQYAYVTVLSSANYLDGIRTLLYSLKKVKSQYPLVVILPVDFDLKCQHAIEAWGGIVEHAERIDLGASIDAIKYMVSCTLHHERYRALCAFTYFKYVYQARRKLRDLK